MIVEGFPRPSWKDFPLMVEGFPLHRRPSLGCPPKNLLCAAIMPICSPFYFLLVTKRSPPCRLWKDLPPCHGFRAALWWKDIPLTQLVAPMYGLCRTQFILLCLSGLNEVTSF